ncbi:MAG: response regulator [Pseudomonadales bacterium]|nr:response regulator [Pseudomonadales bacterium]
MDDPEKLMSAKYVAEHFGVCVATVRTWVEKGWLKAQLTPGGHRRYCLSDLQSFIKEREVKPLLPLTDDRRILIIDDDRDFVFLMLEFFEQYRNLSCDTAFSGFDAGNKIHQFRPDSILLDLNMPGISGFELCETLKNQKQTADIKIVAVSGDCRQSRVNKILALGADAVLAKPISVKAVQEAFQLSDTVNNVAHA